MSRVLADLLGADQLAFRRQLQQLERAAGAPAADIRLGLEITKDARRKMTELGLDARDTNGRELYRALQVRLADDERRAREVLKISTASPSEVLEAARNLVADETMALEVYAVKATAMRAILKKLKPKATMKLLGYRSQDSMFKHESPAQLLVASLVAENDEWHRNRHVAYAKLKARDFEVRKLQYIMPTGKKWPEVAAKYADKYRHNLSVLHELGTVVVLPFDHDLPGLAVTTILLCLDAANDIRSRSAYLKLEQVRPDFGAIVDGIMCEEPMTDAELAGQPLPWKVVHWFYGSGHAAYHPASFEPHVQPEDLAWHTASKTLAQLHVSLEFWSGTDIIGHLDGREVVSLNVLDVALGLCNGLNYADRIVNHMRTSLGRELLARYLHQDRLQEMLSSSLGRSQAIELEFNV